MSMTYAVTLTPDAELGHVVRCRDIPQVLTWGDTPEAAQEQAEDAIEVALLSLMEEGADIPSPTPLQPGEVPVTVPARLAAKVAVYAAWKAAGISKSALAARMGRSEGEVRRILDPRHGTKLEQLDEAARALGGRIVVGFEKAA